MTNSYWYSQAAAESLVEYWEGFTDAPELPSNAVDIIANKIAHGLTVATAMHCIDVAMRSTVPNNRVWRYFLGCCNNRIAEVTK